MGPDLDRRVAGLTCRQVLERLSDYLEGDLSEGERSAVEEHLAGCDGCTRFGGSFGAAVEALRAEPLPRAVPDGLREALRARLADEPLR